MERLKDRWLTEKTQINTPKAGKGWEISLRCEGVCQKDKGPAKKRVNI